MSEVESETYVIEVDEEPQSEIHINDIFCLAIFTVLRTARRPHAGPLQTNRSSL